MLFQEIPATNYKILVHTGTGTRDSSKRYEKQYIIQKIGKSLRDVKLRRHDWVVMKNYT